MDHTRTTLLDARPSKRIKLTDSAQRHTDLPDLDSARHRNGLKLRGTFEAIFNKYGRDFEGVADEIDVTTGEVVVDNGHIRGMRHERDVVARKSNSPTNVTVFRPLQVEDSDDDELSSPATPVSGLNTWPKEY